MSKQLSVQAQNARTAARMAQLATWFSQRPSPLPWLVELLAERGLPPDRGVLVQFEDIPDQAGRFCKGVWLTPNKRFWQFEVLVPKSGAVQLSVEAFREITNDVSISAHSPGVGKSFGSLALEVLEALQHDG